MTHWCHSQPRVHSHCLPPPAQDPLGCSLEQWPGIWTGTPPMPIGDTTGGGGGEREGEKEERRTFLLVPSTLNVDFLPWAPLERDNVCVVPF